MKAPPQKPPFIIERTCFGMKKSRSARSNRASPHTARYLVTTVNKPSLLNLYVALEPHVVCGQLATAFSLFGRLPGKMAFTPRLHRGCDRILGFGRNDRGHSPSVSKTVSVEVSIVSEVISHTLTHSPLVGKVLRVVVRPLASE